MLRAPRTPLAAVPRQGCTRRSRGTPSRATESQHSRSVPAAIKLGIDHKRASGQCLKTRRIQPFKGPLRAWSYRRAEPTRAQPRSTRASACSRRPRCFPQTTVSLKWSVRLPCSPNTHRKPDHNVNTGRKKINLHRPWLQHTLGFALNAFTSKAQGNGLRSLEPGQNSKGQCPWGTAFIESSKGLQSGGDHTDVVQGSSLLMGSLIRNEKDMVTK